MTSREVECGKTENRTIPSDDSTTRTQEHAEHCHVGGVPRYRRRSMRSVAVFSPARPSLWVRTLQRRTATQRVVQTVVSEEIQPAHNGLMVILFAAGVSKNTQHNVKQLLWENNTNL